MTCGKANAVKPDTRRVLAEMYAKLMGQGREEYARQALLKQRLAQCTHATDCGRLCEQLIKGPGKSQVQCWANYPNTPAQMIHLYESLEDVDFTCPKGLF